MGRNSYSLRAFARDLELPASQVIEVMNGKKGFSKKVALSIAEKLKFLENEKDHFLNLVLSEHARSPRARELARIKANRQTFLSKHFTQLERDKLILISDWRYFAIFEAAKLSSFDGTSNWFVKNLGFSKRFVDSALKLIERLNLVSVLNSKLVFSENNIVSSITNPDPYLKNFHTNFLSNASKKLFKVEATEREFISGFVPVELESLKATKQKIRQMVAEFCIEQDKSENSEALYGFSVQFFPISKKASLS